MEFSPSASTQHTHARANAHIHTHTHTHTYRYTHTHTCTHRKWLNGVTRDYHHLLEGAYPGVLLDTTPQSWHDIPAFLFHFYVCKLLLYGPCWRHVGGSFVCKITRVFRYLFRKRYRPYNCGGLDFFRRYDPDCRFWWSSHLSSSGHTTCGEEFLGNSIGRYGDRRSSYSIWRRQMTTERTTLNRYLQGEAIVTRDAERYTKRLAYLTSGTSQSPTPAQQPLISPLAPFIPGLNLPYLASLVYSHVFINPPSSKQCPHPHPPSPGPS